MNCDIHKETILSLGKNVFFLLFPLKIKFRFLLRCLSARKPLPRLKSISTDLSIILDCKVIQILGFCFRLLFSSFFYVIL
jgi:hypothetical protein